MRTCEITASVVTNVVILPDGYVIDPSRKVARGTARYEVHGASGMKMVEYDTMYTAPEGSIIVASDVANLGWTYAGGEFTEPTPQPMGVADLLAYAAEARWRKEVGGLTVGDAAIATDDRSKIMIMGARIAAADNPDWETMWHGTDGRIYPLDAAQMISISDAVEHHVKSTFATYARVKADIEAGEITTSAEIDAAFI